MRSPIPFLFLLALTGCTTIQQRPVEEINISLPAVWNEVSSGSNTTISKGWVKEFKDAKMSKLVDQALRYNHNLKAAATRLRVAKLNTISSRAARLPRLTAGASSSRTQREQRGADSVFDRSYGLSLATNWEVDLWGRLRDLNQASLADYDAAVADFRGAQLSLAASTARSWTNLISAEQRLDLAKSILNSFEKNLRIIERNYKAGVPGVRALDVQFGRNNVASAQRSLVDRKLARDNAARSLQVLLGKYPDAQLLGKKNLPFLRDPIRASYPTILLERRPDLAAARARIFASAKRADASRKNLLPSLSLSANANTGGETLRRAIDPADLVWSIASSVSQTIYQGGAQRAQAQITLEQNRAAIESYSQSALEAMREVETALATDRSLRKQEEFLLVEVRQAALAERQAERDYTEGIEGSSILTVLEAQRRANNSKQSLLLLKNQRIQNRIDLYLALGGNP